MINLKALISKKRKEMAVKLAAKVAQPKPKMARDRYSIYNNGQPDPSTEPGHGSRKNQGLTNYINDHLGDVFEDEKHRR